MKEFILITLNLFVQRVLCRTTKSSHHFAEAMVSLLLAVVVVHATPGRLACHLGFAAAAKVKNLLNTWRPCKKPHLKTNLAPGFFWCRGMIQTTGCETGCCLDASHIALTRERRDRWPWSQHNTRGSLIQILHSCYCCVQLIHLIRESVRAQYQADSARRFEYAR